MSNLLPEGRYKAIVHDFSTGASNTKGTPYIKLGFRILAGDHQGRIIDAMFWVTDKTMPRIATDLMALGYTSDEDPLAAFGNAKTLADVPCEARPVQIVVKHEEFNGRVDAHVAYINALSKEAPPATAESRAAWKSAFQAARQSAGTQRAPAPQPIEDAPFLPPHPATHLSRPGGPGKPGPRARGVMRRTRSPKEIRLAAGLSIERCAVAAEVTSPTIRLFEADPSATPRARAKLEAFYADLDASLRKLGK